MINKITSVSDELLNFLEEFESFRSKPYLCPAGVPTIGFGTTFYFDTKRRVTMKDKSISIEEARRLKKGHLESVFCPLVDRLCRDDLKQNEFDALVSFVYNAGATYRSRKNGRVYYYNIFKHVNNRMNGQALYKYWTTLAVTGGGKRLNGLVRRRMREVRIYQTGNYD